MDSKAFAKQISPSGVIDDLSFDELCNAMHGLCRQANELREHIRYLNGKIEERQRKMLKQSLLREQVASIGQSG